MPLYVYRCNMCLKEHERNVPVDQRDLQECKNCKSPLYRKIAFTGSVWAPTSGGMR